MESEAPPGQQIKMTPLPAWLLMVVLVAGHAVKHLYNAGYFIVLPEIRTTFALSNTALGVLSSARTISSSLANFPAGFLSDRFNRHWGAILGLALIVMGASNFAMGVAGIYWLLFIASLIFGGAISFWHPAAIATLTQRFPHRVGLAISLHGMGGSIGEATGPILVGALLLLMVWQTVLQLSFLPLVATGALVWLLMRSAQGQTSNSTMVDYLNGVRRLMRNPALLTVLLITGVFTTAQAAVVTFLPVYLRLDLGYSAIQMTAFVSAAQVAGIFSQPTLGSLSDRFGRRAVLVPSLLSLGVGLLAIGLVPAGWPLAISVTAMGAFQFPLMALFLASAMDVVPKEVQATTVSLVFGMGTIFSSISPTIAGFLADAFEVRVVFFYAAILAALAASLLAASGRGQAR